MKAPVKALLLAGALLALAACTSADRSAMTGVFRDINQALIPIGAIAGGR